MKAYNSPWKTLLLAIVVALVCVSCAKKSGAAGTTQGTEYTAPPAGSVVVEGTWTDTVVAVDRANRTVTLKDPDGTVGTYQMGSEVRNFDQIRVGDTVRTTVTEALAVSVRKAGEPPAASETTTVTRAPLGAKPGATVTKTTDLTGKIKSVDLKNRTVVIQGITGESKAYMVGPDVDLSRVKAGDDVVLKYTQSLSIKVEKP